nr:cobamide remodeling phosphodiesterase CbiR [Candidatus Njordarchaeum guaymaensis]
MIIGTEVGSLIDIVANIPADKEGLESVDFDHLRLSRRAKKLIDAGFRHVEIAIDTRFMVPGVADDTVIGELLEIKKTRGVSYSVHLPLMDMSFLSLNERSRKATMECLKESIEATQPLEITGYVLHTTRFVESEIASLPQPTLIKRRIYKYIVEKGGRGLSELIDVAGNPRKILIEPDCALPYDIFLDPLLEEYDTGICFDYGHCAMSKQNPYDFYDHYIDRIHEIHFHDVQVPYRIDHIPLGAGTTEWEKFIKHIAQGKVFKGVLLLEMMESAAIASLPKLIRVLEAQKQR